MVTVHVLGTQDTAVRGPSVGQWGAGRLSASRMRCSLDPVGANTAEPFLKTGTWFPTTCQVQGGARLGAGQSLSPTEGSLAASKFGGRPQLGPPSVPSNCGMGNPVEGRTSQGKAPQTSRQPSKRGEERKQEHRPVRGGCPLKLAAELSWEVEGRVTGLEQDARPKRAKTGGPSEHPMAAGDRPLQHGREGLWKRPAPARSNHSAAGRWAAVKNVRGRREA